MLREQLARTERIKKAEQLKKSYELLRLCREVMANEGINWTKSKERRELEHRKQ